MLQHAAVQQASTWAPHLLDQLAAAHAARCPLGPSPAARLACPPTRRTRRPSLAALPRTPQGIKNVPKRLRVVIQRKRAEDDEDSEEMFSVVSLAEDQNTKKGVVVLEA